MKRNCSGCRLLNTIWKHGVIVWYFKLSIFTKVIQSLWFILYPSEGDADKANSLSLSTEGHVQDLISEATDERNLAKMYVGWAAYF